MLVLIGTNGLDGGTFTISTKFWVFGIHFCRGRGSGGLGVIGLYIARDERSRIALVVLKDAKEVNILRSPDTM